MKKGGDGGPVLIAGNTQASPLIQRLHLPLEEKEHMPPKGKKQLSDNEIALLEWWVLEGAPFDKSVGEIKQSEGVTKILKTYEQSSIDINTSGLSKVTSKQKDKLEAAGISVFPHNAESPLVHVGFSRDTLLTKGKLKKLNSISNNRISSMSIPLTKGPEPASLKSFLLEFESTEAQYVKVKVLGTLKNPSWHPAPGAKNWIFIDEILVN